ncbi:hypothetical protein OAL44_01125 [Planctomycetaceae bacterium]|nr:hypothetical protein [Planctomycetaceae bacterium]
MSPDAFELRTLFEKYEPEHRLLAFSQDDRLKWCEVDAVAWEDAASILGGAVHCNHFFPKIVTGNDRSRAYSYSLLCQWIADNVIETQEGIDPEETVIPDGQPSRDSSNFWCRVSELSGMECPPSESVGWVSLLSKASFPQSRIEQFLNEIGYEGFDSVGEMPRGYVSTRMASGTFPVFSAMLLSGLERWAEKNLPSKALPATEPIAGQTEDANRAKGEEDAGKGPPPKTGYLGLIVCDKSKTIEREGTVVTIDFSTKKNKWSVFWNLYQSKALGMSSDSLKSKFSGAPSSFGSSITSTRNELYRIGLSISSARSGNYKIIEK